MKFYIDCESVSMCYPQGVTVYLKNVGVLEQYRDKYYTLEQINKIVADLIIKTPYINNSMEVYVDVMCVEDNICGYHHMLNFYNYNYAEQKRTKDKEIKFMF